MCYCLEGIEKDLFFLNLCRETKFQGKSTDNILLQNQD